MIKSLEVKNFRNIPNGIYDLTQRSMIAGKNFTGKTNLLNAIYWVLTDKLLGDSSDVSSLKPSNDKKAEVYVKLVFDNNHYIEKAFKEKWVTTRGTGIERLEGHETKTIIDDLVIPASKVAEKIKNDFLKITLSTSSRVDLVQTFIDPLYLFDNTNLKTKDKRAFLVELVGDVELSKVYACPDIASNSFLSEVQNKIAFYNDNISQAMTYYRDIIKRINDELSVIAYQLEGEKGKVDVDPEKLKEAQTRLSELNQLIDARKQMKATMVNPMIEKIKGEISEKKNVLNNVYESLQADFKKEVAAVDEKNKMLNDEIKKYQNDLKDIEKEILSINEKIYSCKAEIKNNELNIANKESEILAKREEFKRIAAKEYTPINMPKAISCPYCGGIINDDLIESIIRQNEDLKISFEEEKSNQLMAIREAGHAAKSEIERLKLANTELNKQLICYQNDLKNCEKSKENLTSQIQCSSNLLAPYPTFQVDECYKSIQLEITALRSKLEDEIKVDVTANIDAEISAYKEEMKTYDSIISNHQYYVHTQEYIANLEANMDAKRKAKAQEESKLMLCELILTTKLEMLKKHVETVFGDIEIKLVESNIKEGSWNEVCYPVIIDEKTGSKVPFENASRSQKYIYGIKLIECLKSVSNTSVDIPILIDEIGTFDNETIASRLVTKAQIIATKCDDNFEKPTIVNF